MSQVTPIEYIQKITIYCPSVIHPLALNVA